MLINMCVYVLVDLSEWTILESNKYCISMFWHSVVPVSKVPGSLNFHHDY